MVYTMVFSSHFCIGMHGLFYGRHMVFESPSYLLEFSERILENIDSNDPIDAVGVIDVVGEVRRLLLQAVQSYANIHFPGGYHRHKRRAYSEVFGGVGEFPRIMNYFPVLRQFSTRTRENQPVHPYHVFYSNNPRYSKDDSDPEI